MTEAPVEPSSTDATPTIVVGYSSKPEGRAALARAINEASLRTAPLLVVRTAGDSDADELATDLAGSGVAYTVHPNTEAEDPAEELLSVAESTGAQFIVIGLRRRSPVGKLLLGSNAQRVLLDANCPVLAVKA